MGVPDLAVARSRRADRSRRSEAVFPRQNWISYPPRGRGTGAHIGLTTAQLHLGPMGPIRGPVCPTRLRRRAPTATTSKRADAAVRSATILREMPFGVGVVQVG